MNEQKDKYVIITGASAGFGKATAQVLASNGFNLILIARRINELNTIKEEILSSFDISIETIEADVRDFPSLDRLLRPLISSKQIEALINNAGLASGLSTILEGDMEDWDKMLDTNVKGLLNVTKIVLPKLVSQNSGTIINISSIAGKEVYANGNVYCASKHAVEAISKALRIENAIHHIRVTNISPGAADTEFSLVRFKGDKERADSVYLGFNPLQAADIAETIRWVLSLPPHVTINDLVIMPTNQPIASVIHKNIT